MLARALAAAMIGGIVNVAMPAHAAPSTCRALLEEALAASRVRDVGRAERAYERAQEPERACSAFMREVIGRAVAHTYYRRAFSDVSDPAVRARLLEVGLHYGRPWRVLAAMGDLYRDRKEWARAARFYQEALDDMRDRRRNPKAPPIATFRAIYKKAETALLMAQRLVAVTNKAGALGGVLDYAPYKGWTPATVALPITFEYDSTRFTPEGEHAAKLLLKSLAGKREPISLIGHTDPRGPAVYNQRLSERRAEAVRRWLSARGYGGPIRIEGRGESEPYEPDDPGRYSQEERWQMDRRVVLRFD